MHSTFISRALARYVLLMFMSCPAIMIKKLCLVARVEMTWDATIENSNGETHVMFEDVA